MSTERSDSGARGRYRVEGRLGAGGMGEVFRGHDLEKDRPVALKRIKTASHHRQARERFEREVRVLRRLGQHPGLVEIYDVVRRDEQAWVVMELIEGRTLRQVLAEESPFPPSRAAALAGEIAAGLAAVHAAGIVHRDLKASNVMVTDDDHAKLLDFGLARALEPTASLPTLTQHGKLLGSAAAMSPEQAEGERVDERSDLFSLGTMLYEMASGRSPFAGRHLVDTLDRVRSHRQTPLREVRPEVPEALAKLVDELLEKDPDDRPSGAEEVARRLAEIAADL